MDVFKQDAFAPITEHALQPLHFRILDLFAIGVPQTQIVAFFTIKILGNRPHITPIDCVIFLNYSYSCQISAFGS